MNSALLRELDRLRTAGDPASARAEIVRMFEAVRSAAYEDAARVCEELSKDSLTVQKGRPDDLSNVQIRIYSAAQHACAVGICARAKEVKP